MIEFRKKSLLSLLVHLLVLTVLIYMCTKISFIFYPVKVLFQTLFAPIVIALFLYYILNPIILLIEKFIKKRSLAIFLMGVVVVGGIGLLIGLIIPNLLFELTNLIRSLPEFIRNQQEWVDQFLTQPRFEQLDIKNYWKDLTISYGQLSSQLLQLVMTSLTSLALVLSRSIILIVTIPIVLFYMFKDGQKLPKALLVFVPQKYQEKSEKLIGTINQTLAAYIGGQAIVCLYVGTGAYISFKLLGIPYAFLLACIAGMMDIIPYLGPWIGVAPAFFIAWTDSWQTAIILAVSIIIIQLGESYLVYPLVMGKSLNMHPLTIILILLVAGKLAGLVGMILALPTYSICKLILLSGVDLYLENEEQYESSRE